MSSKEKRLFLNSLYMYIRMGFVMIITLYSSRKLLNILGIEDFGIYNIVGSIISLVMMFQTFFSYTTQRYFNFEIGKGDYKKLNVIFNTSLFINIVISIIFVLIIEVIGYYLFNYKLNINEARESVAQNVFHISVISSVILITSSTYDALIIAYEKFSLYSFISVLKNVLLLLIIYIVEFCEFDRLLFYSILVLLIHLTIRIFLSIYCMKNYSVTKLNFSFDRSVFKDMLSFSGWQLLGISAYTITQNCLNILFNMYIGVIANAARGIAYQVNIAINQLSNNINVAITPYSIKAYARGDVDTVNKMFYLSSKIMFVITFICIIPALFFTEEILHFWLGETIPEYSVDLVQIVLFISLVRSVHNPIDTVFKAIGSIKYYQIIEGILLLSPLIFSWLSLYFKLSINIAFSQLLIFEIINLYCILYYLKKVFSFDLMLYYKEILIPMFVFSIVLISFLYFEKSFEISLCLKFLIMLFVLLLSSISIYFHVFNFEERQLFKKYIYSIKIKI